jgi:hypothetical protein
MTSVTVANAYGSARAFRRAHPVLARLDELRHRKDGFVFLELTPADQAEDPPQSSSNATAST